MMSCRASRSPRSDCAAATGQNIVRAAGGLSRYFQPYWAQCVLLTRHSDTAGCSQTPIFIDARIGGCWMSAKIVRSFGRASKRLPSRESKNRRERRTCLQVREDHCWRNSPDSVHGSTSGLRKQAKQCLLSGSLFVYSVTCLAERTWVAHGWTCDRCPSSRCRLFCVLRLNKRLVL